MNSVRRVAKNTIFLILSNLVQKALTLFLVIFIARELGVEAFGLYSFALSFVVMFTLLADLGVNLWVTREVAREREKVSAILGKSIPAKIVASIFSIFAIYFSVSLLGYSSFEVWLVVLAGVSMALDSFAGLFRSIFFSFERMEFEALINIIYKVSALVLSFFVLLSGFGVLALLYVLVFSSLLNFLLSFIIVAWKIAPPKISLDRGFLKNAFFSALPFCFFGIFATIYSNVDVVMLQMIKGNEAVGVYSAAFRLITTIGFIYVAYMSSIYPMMTRLFAQNRDALELVVQRSFKYLFIIILPIVFGTFVLSERIIVFFYGQEFAAGGLALCALIWTSLFAFANVLLAHVMNSINKEKLNSVIFFLTLVVNVALNLFLIPTYSFFGAAIASILSEALFFVLVWRFSDVLSLRPLWRPMVKALIAATAMTVFLFYFAFLNLLLLFLLGGLVYFTLIYLFRVFDQMDASLFKKLLPS